MIIAMILEQIFHICQYRRYCDLMQGKTSRAGTKLFEDSGIISESEGFKACDGELIQLVNL